MNEQYNKDRTPLHVLRAYLIFTVVNFALLCVATQIKIWVFGKGGMEWYGVGIGLILLSVVLSPLNTLLLYILSATNVNNKLLKSAIATGVESISYFTIGFVVYNMEGSGKLGPFLFPFAIIVVMLIIYKLICRRLD